ncbi:FtsX-like permease family protein [Acetobacterium sp.]|uniref:FtsX-like permease family protein n=1 Tax=Acetobacterium sp. TaxID=1872094 RepID=UPI002F40D7C6
MNRLFYPKLAFLNLRKNANTYIPYILTCIGSIVTFYIMISIYGNKGLDTMPGSENLKIILFLGTIFIGIFSVIFLFYTNSFLIKRRKKELGLYSILGLEKKHIARVLFYETLFSSTISLVLGLLGGILIGKLLFLLLLRMIHFQIPLAFSVDVFGLIVTAIVFLIVFLLTLLTNFLQVKLANPIDLLKGGEQGEKEPKASWIVTIIGLISLGVGYTIALMVESPVEAIFLFFVAVLFVIIGTYALFTSGSIALLKLLKRNKKYYYQSRNFISVSGMIYRMKQNAVGLASICILCTMVLVTISTTVSLYIGQESMMRDLYPLDVGIIGTASEVDPLATQSLIATEKTKANVEVTDVLVFNFNQIRTIRDGNLFLPDNLNESNSDAMNYEAMSELWVIPLDDYNRITQSDKTLTENEVMIFSVSENYGENSMMFGNNQFSVKEELESIPMDQKKGLTIGNKYYLIVKDEQTMTTMLQSLNGNEQSNALQAATLFNLKGTEDAKMLFSENLEGSLAQTNPNISMDNLYLSMSEWYILFGGFLFLGVFLGSLFIMATVLIIYFKQISEGYEDCERFEIMQKVGMDKKEVKKTIGKQILMVFFLPLAVAFIHVGFALPVMIKMLAVFRLTETSLIILCTGVTALVFAVFYALVFMLTAKSYYKLVKQER